MNAVENQVRDLVKIELAAANERFPQFQSAHEGYAVIREELEETEEKVEMSKKYLKFLWDSIKMDGKTKWAVEYMKELSINAACEAIQVAAMCQKFLEMEKDHG